MKTLDNFELNKKNIIFRADLNVPVVDGKIRDYSRIDSIIPSIDQLKKNKNKIFIIAHFGRPKGKPNKKLSLKFLCEELRLKLKDNKIHFLNSFQSEDIKKKQFEMKSGEVCLFENIRFYEQEEKNDHDFSEQLASNFEIYVNDAFSASHRKHSSIVGLPKFIPSFAGLNFTKEINNLNTFLIESKKPNLAIIGGSKISTKINVIYNLINLFDTVVIGGAMANTFLEAKKINVGNSIYEKEFVNIAEDILRKVKKNKCKIILPIDAVCATALKDNIKISHCNIKKIPSSEMVLDIGENTIELITQEISKCQSVLWNGPVGAFEHIPFEKGSIQIANSIKKNFKKYNFDSLAGGGDTLSAINLAKAQDGFSYLSNAGGAFLEWLEGNKSPGYIALEKNKF